MKKKLLITGVSGLLGSNLALAYRDKYDVTGVCNQHKINIDGINTTYFDLLGLSALKKLVDELNPDIVIHSAALANIDKCEEDKVLAERLNVEVTDNIVKSLIGRNAYLIHISTDAVYDGIKGDFNEDEANPINHYARTKLLGEDAALRYKNTLVVRTNFFGWNIQDKLSLSEWVLHSLSSKKEINGFSDVYFSALYTFSLSGILEKAFKNKLKGIYNLGSSDSMSKYDFAVRIAETFSLDKRLIKEASVDDLGLSVIRSKNMSLNVKKIEKAVNADMPSMENSIAEFYKDYKNGIQSKLRSR